MRQEETLSELLDNLEFYREQYHKDCSQAIKLRYFLSAKRYYKAKFEETKDETYKELYEQALKVHDIPDELGYGLIE